MPVVSALAGTVSALGLPLLGVHDTCSACGHTHWLVYVSYRRCAACQAQGDAGTYVKPVTKDETPVAQESAHGFKLS